MPLESTDEFALRRTRAAAALADHKLDALFVYNGPNVQYLTGFTGSNGHLLIFRDQSIFFTDPRYRVQSAAQVSCAVRVGTGPLIPLIAKTVTRKRVKRLAFERNRISFETYQSLEQELRGGARLIPLNSLIESFRLVKSPEELDRIRASVILNSCAFEQAVGRAKPAMREFELAAEIDYRMRRLGAEGPAFDTIVVSGARTALPHARPGDQRLGQGRLLMIDMGARRNAYTSDMTRMLHAGSPPKPVRDLYRAVLDAQLAALAAVRPGVPASTVDAAARRVLAKVGLEKAFVHSTGHGLGLEIHEPPRLGRREKIRLVAGMAITIEPGAYLENFGGVRVEDTVIVTETGCEVLTPTPKDLREF